MLQENACVDVGLFNGATGKIVKMYAPESVDPHETAAEAVDRMSSPNTLVDITIVLVQLDELCYRGPSVLADVPRAIAISAIRKRIQAPFPATIHQLPLVQANAFSVHETQALTLKSVAIDRSIFCAPVSWYVALSRVRSLENITLLLPVTRSGIERSKRFTTDVGAHIEEFKKRFSTPTSTRSDITSSDSEDDDMAAYSTECEIA